ncbi:MAG: hypothetical protein ACLTEX_00825 [Eggerthella lenta]
MGRRTWDVQRDHVELLVVSVFWPTGACRCSPATCTLKPAIEEWGAAA